jgi:hypothetical protein
MGILLENIMLKPAMVHIIITNGDVFLCTYQFMPIRTHRAHVTMCTLKPNIVYRKKQVEIKKLISSGFKNSPKKSPAI